MPEIPSSGSPTECAKSTSPYKVWYEALVAFARSLALPIERTRMPKSGKVIAVVEGWVQVPVLIGASKATRSDVWPRCAKAPV